MISEISKFVSVYNTLVSDEKKIDISYIVSEYDVFIRILGNYIYQVFNTESWIDSTLEFGSIVVDFSVFRDSQHRQRVHQFLLSLKNAFYDDSLDNEVNQFLNDTSEFNEDEKKICREFYDVVSTLNKAIKREAFLNIDVDMSSKTMISRYQTELKEYNDFIVKHIQHRNVISKFDVFFKQIAANKKHMNITF